MSWRLTRELSLDYKIDLLRLPLVSDTIQAAQRVLFSLRHRLVNAHRSCRTQRGRRALDELP